MLFGSIIVSVFAAVWFAMGLRAAGVPWNFAVSGIALSIITVGATALRERSLPPRPAEAEKRIGKIIGRASLFEGIAIPAAAITVSSLGHPELVMPAIAFIVGLHFLPIAWFLGWTLYYPTGLALIGLAVATPAMAPSQTTAQVIIGTGAAIILWASCWARLR